MKNRFVLFVDRQFDRCKPMRPCIQSASVQIFACKPPPFMQTTQTSSRFVVPVNIAPPNPHLSSVAERQAGHHLI